MVDDERTTGSPSRTNGPSSPGSAQRLAVLAAGVAVVQLLPDLGPRPVRLAAGLVLAGLSLMLAATSHRRWRQVDRAIRSGPPLTRPWQPALTAVGMSITVIIAMILMLTD